MTTPTCQRLAARILLVTFTTCAVACGGAASEAPATTTTTAEPAPPPTIALPSTTLPLPPPAEPPPTLPAKPPEQLGKQDLRELVAPVALYPDVVLASLLPATTNGDQVHEAAQFVGNAERVERVPDDRGWDGSVIGLLQFPDVLRWLDQNPAWTDAMGQAVTYQQGDVLDAIQDYRHAAMDVGNLKSNQYQKVRAVPDQDIRIEPARPDVVYVPSYDPAIATQPQPPAASPGINPWIAFGGGAVVGALGAWALYSIFDDDRDHYRGPRYGRRRICGYDSYYYAGRRRPRPVEWAPRPRPYRPRPQGWQRTRRLEYVPRSTRPARGAGLRPPVTRPGGPPQRPREVRRERQQEQKQQRQENRQEKRQVERQQKQQRQETRQEKRQERQGNRQGQRQQRQEQRQERQGERQQRQEQRQEQRQQQRQMRQENRQQKRQEGGAQKPTAKRKKKQANGQ